MTADYPPVLTLEEAAGLLRVHINTLYTLAASGRVPCRKVGRQYRFTRAVLLQWLEGADVEDGDGLANVYALVPSRLAPAGAASRVH